MSIHDMSPSSTFSMDDDDEKNIKIENKDPDKDSDKDDDIEENCEKHTEIQEQVYQDKLGGFRKQLRQLEERSHPEYAKKFKALESQQKNRSIMNNAWRESESDAIEREFVKECRLAHKEFEDRKHELTETLIADLIEKKKAIEYDYLTMELSPDSADQKPAMTRKLRRRPNDPVVPAAQEKRRKPPPVPHINYLLQDHEIEHDVKAIQEVIASMSSASTSATTTVKTHDTVNSSSVGKSGFLPSTSSSAGNLSPKKSHSSDNEGSSSIPDTRIEDGKLLFEKRWYHRGQPVFVEGRQMPKFPAVISAIGNETIWVKNVLDNSKFLINLSYLSKGKMSIKRRAAV